MAFGMEVGLSPRHVVLDGDPAALPKKGAEPPPNFRPICTEVDLDTGHIVFYVVPAVRERGTAASPAFSPMSIVATVAHLSYC